MEIYRRRLPHAFAENTPIFVTWRMKFSLPRKIIESMAAENKAFEKQISSLSEDYQNLQRYQFSKKQFDKYDQMLTKDHSFPHLLIRPEIASIVQSSISFLDGRKYCLHSYCIMSNHVHLLITPFIETGAEKQAVRSMTHSLKRFTAREINKLLFRQGPFWAQESYDHLVRNDKEFYRIAFYILNNPVKAGLVEDWKQWRYTWLHDDLKELFD